MLHNELLVFSEFCFLSKKLSFLLDLVRQSDLFHSHCRNILEFIGHDLVFMTLLLLGYLQKHTESRYQMPPVNIATM